MKPDILQAIETINRHQALSMGKEAFQLSLGDSFGYNTPFGKSKPSHFPFVLCVRDY